MPRAIAPDSAMPHGIWQASTPFSLHLDAVASLQFDTLARMRRRRRRRGHLSVCGLWLCAPAYLTPVHCETLPKTQGFSIVWMVPLSYVFNLVWVLPDVHTHTHTHTHTHIRMTYVYTYIHIVIHVHTHLQKHTNRERERARAGDKQTHTHTHTN